MTPQLRGRGMIELGAGCGLCGITAAKLCGCLPAMLTDFAAPTMANLKHNLTINGMSAEECSKALDWRDQSTWPPAQPVVIGADLIYAREAVEPLLAAVSGLVSPGGAFLYVAPETNRQGEAEFLTGLCARGWECQRSDVPPSYLTNAFVKPQPAGGGGAAGGDAAMEEGGDGGGSEEDFFALFTELKQLPSLLLHADWRDWAAALGGTAAAAAAAERRWGGQSERCADEQSERQQA